MAHEPLPEPADAAPVAASGAAPARQPSTNLTTSASMVSTADEACFMAVAEQVQRDAQRRKAVR